MSSNGPRGEYDGVELLLVGVLVGGLRVGQGLLRSFRGGRTRNTGVQELVVFLFLPFSFFSFGRPRLGLLISDDLLNVLARHTRRCYYSVKFCLYPYM